MLALSKPILEMLKHEHLLRVERCYTKGALDSIFVICTDTHVVHLLTNRELTDQVYS